jgi:hypothetical protein
VPNLGTPTFRLSLYKNVATNQWQSPRARVPGDWKAEGARNPASSAIMSMRGSARYGSFGPDSCSTPDRLPGAHHSVPSGGVIDGNRFSAAHAAFGRA